MNRNWREATGQRNLGNVVRPGAEKSQVEIIDDEDDEVEEISSVSVEILFVRCVISYLYLAKKLTAALPQHTDAKDRRV